MEEVVSADLRRLPGHAVGEGRLVSINLDAYYRGLAAEELQGLGDRLLALAGEAQEAGADDAAWRLSDASTQLLDLGMGIGGQVTPPDEPV